MARATKTKTKTTSSLGGESLRADPTELDQALRLRRADGSAGFELWTTADDYPYLALSACVDRRYVHSVEL